MMFAFLWRSYWTKWVLFILQNNGPIKCCCLRPRKCHFSLMFRSILFENILLFFPPSEQKNRMNKTKTNRSISFRNIYFYDVSLKMCVFGLCAASLRHWHSSPSLPCVSLLLLWLLFSSFKSHHHRKMQVTCLRQCVSCRTIVYSIWLVCCSVVACLNSLEINEIFFFIHVCLSLSLSLSMWCHSKFFMTRETKHRYLNKWRPRKISKEKERKKKQSVKTNRRSAPTLRKKRTMKIQWERNVKP